jgi:outer membrane cobalamin receptor
MRSRLVVAAELEVAEIDDVDELLARRTSIKFRRNGG